MLFRSAFDAGYQTHVEAYINLIATGEPVSFKEAITCPDKDKWETAMDEEMTSLMDMGTFALVDRPKDRRIISCKWVWRIKRDSKGNVERYKARLVARGFTQIHGLDYMDTYAPVTRLETIHLLCALATEKDWEVRHIDVKTAYLNGDLDKEVYMEIPEGFDNYNGGKVLLLRKALYGLKQAGRQWY